MMGTGLTISNMVGERDNTGTYYYLNPCVYHSVYIIVLVTPMKATGLMVSGMVMVACTGVTEESSTLATGCMENR